MQISNLKLLNFIILTPKAPDCSLDVAKLSAEFKRERGSALSNIEIKLLESWFPKWRKRFTRPWDNTKSKAKRFEDRRSILLASAGSWLGKIIEDFPVGLETESTSTSNPKNAGRKRLPVDELSSDRRKKRCSAAGKYLAAGAETDKIAYVQNLSSDQDLPAFIRKGMKQLLETHRSPGYDVAEAVAHFGFTLGLSKTAYQDHRNSLIAKGLKHQIPTYGEILEKRDSCIPANPHYDFNVASVTPEALIEHTFKSLFKVSGKDMNLSSPLTH